MFSQESEPYVGYNVCFVNSEELFKVTVKYVAVVVISQVLLSSDGERHCYYRDH